MGCGANTQKVLALEMSTGIILSESALRSPLIAKCTLQSVSTEELKLTSRLFRDLASRSCGSVIDKTTFLQFFPLPVYST